MTTDALDAEQVEELEAERDFLLKSLDDLDPELVAGNIDPDTYRTLHDDYTARAAAVITALEDGRAPTLPDGPKVSPVMRFVTIGGIVVFAVLAAFLLAKSVGQRHPGQQITGDAQASGATGANGAGTAARELAAAQAAAAKAPKSYDARIRLARAELGAGQLDQAIRDFVAASQLDPKQGEPLAYAGWISATAANQVTDAAAKTTLLDAAGRTIDRAITVDPTYADAYIFKGLLLSQIEGKPCEGVAPMQKFLVLAPEAHPMRSMVLDALAQAVKAGHCPSAPTPSK